MPTAHSLAQTGTETAVPRRNQDSNKMQSALKMYKTDTAQNLSPVEIIKRVYDLAIVACKKHDEEKAHKIIGELIVNLDYSHGDLPVQLFHLYQYCRTCIREHKFNEAVNILEGLRAAWTEAFKL
jgi:flagellin-specific chaperone FliS